MNEVDVCSEEGSFGLYGKDVGGRATQRAIQITVSNQGLNNQLLSVNNLLLNDFTYMHSTHHINFRSIVITC